MQCVLAMLGSRSYSNVHLTKMRSVSLIRCLPKMSASSSTSTGSQIATWRRSLTRTRHDFNHDLRSPSTGQMFVWDHQRFSLNPAQRDILLHRQSLLSDLTIRLHITTFLTSILQIRWLYHQMFKRCFHQFNSLNVSHVTNHSSFSLVNRLVADVTVKAGHKYVNIHRHQFLIFNTINIGWSMAVIVLQRKASTQQIGLLL